MKSKLGPEIEGFERGGECWPAYIDDCQYVAMVKMAISMADFAIRHPCLLYGTINPGIHVFGVSRGSEKKFRIMAIHLDDPRGTACILPAGIDFPKSAEEATQPVIAERAMTLGAFLALGYDGIVEALDL